MLICLTIFGTTKRLGDLNFKEKGVIQTFNLKFYQQFHLSLQPKQLPNFQNSSPPTNTHTHTHTHTHIQIHTRIQIQTRVHTQLQTQQKEPYFVYFQKTIKSSQN